MLRVLVQKNKSVLSRKFDKSATAASIFVQVSPLSVRIFRLEAFLEELAYSQRTASVQPAYSQRTASFIARFGIHISDLSLGVIDSFRQRSHSPSTCQHLASQPCKLSDVFNAELEIS